MVTFENRLVEALDVGAWRLEDEPRYRFTATPELHTELVRLLGAVAEHGVSLCHGAKDLLFQDVEKASTVLFTYKSHLNGRHTDQTSRYNEIDLRFRQGLKVQGKSLELVSIFHTEDLDLLDYPELVGGRHIKNWGSGVLGIPVHVPKIPFDAPDYDSIDVLKNDVEELCPVTPEGMVNVLSKQLRF